MRLLTRLQHVLLGDQVRLCAVLAAALLCAMPAAGSAPSADTDAPPYQSPERSAGGLDTLRGTFDRDGALSLLTDNLRWAVDIAGRIKAPDDSGFTNQQFFGIGILETLPFTIHENELGTHTLYMVFADNDELMGIVHVRTERSRGGLTEIAWTFNSDREIVGMHFQRSRDRYRKYIEIEAFQKEIRGKNFDELRTLLTKNGEAINEAVLVIPSEGQELALNVIQSALKTISATQSVWHDSLPVVNR